MAALDLVFDAIGEIVAEIIEAELVVRAVGDVRAIGFAPRDRAAKIPAGPKNFRSSPLSFLQPASRRPSEFPIPDRRRTPRRGRCSRR